MFFPPLSHTWPFCLWIIFLFLFLLLLEIREGRIWLWYMKYILVLNHRIYLPKGDKERNEDDFQEKKANHIPVLKVLQQLQFKWLFFCLQGLHLMPLHAPEEKDSPHFCLHYIQKAIFTEALDTWSILLGPSEEKFLESRRGKDFQVKILKLKIIINTTSTHGLCSKSEKRSSCCGSQVKNPT